MKLVEVITKGGRKIKVHENEVEMLHKLGKLSAKIKEEKKVPQTKEEKKVPENKEVKKNPPLSKEPVSSARNLKNGS